MCAKVFVDKNTLWQDLVPPSDTDSTQLVEEFFACVAALMSIQLRSMVINSLADFLKFFETHKVLFVDQYWPLSSNPVDFEHVILIH